MKNLVASNKFDVIGLEARDRVGGRVYTDKQGNEIGAAWIHGTEREHENGSNEPNPVLTMAQSFIPADDLHPTMNFIAVHSDGSELESDSSIWDNMWKVLNKIKLSDESRLNAYEPTQISIYDFISKNWTFLFSPVRGACEMAVVKAVFEWQSYYACNWETTSVGSMAVDKEFEGDQLLIKNGGYTRMLNHYLDGYGLRPFIRLEAPVSKIQRFPDGPTLVTIAQQSVINPDGTISKVEGSVLEADIVVVTVPLGVLKKGDIIFEPPLPEYKQESIRNLGFGVYDKVFVTFASSIEFEDGSFWPSGADVISVVPRTNDDYNEFLCCSLPHIASKNPECLNHVRRNYDDREHDHIGIEIANISAVAGKPKIAMLIYERAAREMEEFANDEQALINFARAKLTNAFPNKFIPEIIGAQATAWGKDKFSYGSFANIPLGASGLDMVNLSLPVDDKILFAGEATFPLHYSTVHGALKSGRREFARLMNMFYPDDENEFADLL